MYGEKSDGQCEACGGMFRIEARADRRSEVADNCFRDAVEAERNGRAAEAVLQNADRHTEKQSCGGVPPAQAKVDDDEHRKIQNRGFREIDGQKSLQHEGKGRGQDDRACPELVHLDVQFAAAYVVGVVHGFSGEDGLVAAAEGAATGGDTEPGATGSCFNSSGFRVSSTKTSSRRSRLAAGFTRSCLKGLPDLISAMVPTGRSRGKMRSMPLVTTRSPEFTLSSLGMYFITSSGSPVAPTGPWSRDSTSMAPTPLCSSVSSKTCAVSL